MRHGGSMKQTGLLDIKGKRQLVKAYEMQDIDTELIEGGIKLLRWPLSPERICSSGGGCRKS